MTASCCFSQTDTATKVCIKTEYAKKAIEELLKYDLCLEEVKSLYVIKTQLELDTQSYKAIIQVLNTSVAKCSETIDFYRERDELLMKENAKLVRKYKRNKLLAKITTTATTLSVAAVLLVMNMAK